jgi:TolB-like protein
MSSLVPEFEYDIFISYRQKDNKHDGWVTKFVENLKGELESTFKEDISIYFDANPHDRLQETHNVDKSLEAKLRCLIFIPVLSQTYCDTNSYAWQYEFLAFLRIAENDHFGKDVKLRGGNVASRILPIRIHDLEQEDIKLFEKETGSVLRSMDFVFKTASGVNRPLQSDEDRPNDNLNKTLYRDQINKVALAIKEIVIGIKTESSHVIKGYPHNTDTAIRITPEEIRSDMTKPSVSNRNKPLFSLASVLIIIFLGIILYLKIFRNDKFENLRDTDGRISIAVMPFSNLTGDTTLNWFQTGVSSLIINGLGSSKELAVSDDQTMYDVIESLDKVYAAGLSPALAKKAAEKVQAETYVSGSFQGTEGKYRILVNLVDTKRGDIIYTGKVEGDLKSSGYLSLTDTLCNEIKNFLEIKALEQNADYDFREAYPASAEAYKYFIEGLNLILSSDYEPAIKSLKKALEIDSAFTMASFYISFAYNFSDRFEEGQLWIQKAYKTKDKLPSKYQNWLEIWYACDVSRSQKDIIRYCNLLEKSGIESRLMWFDLGTTYYNFSDLYKKAVEAFDKVDKISQSRGDEWRYDRYYTSYCEALLLADMPERVQLIADKGLKINPDNFWLTILNGSSYVMLKDTVAVANSISEIRSLANKYKALKSDEEWAIGYMFLWAKDTIRAAEHYRNACNLNPEDLGKINDLTMTLIRAGIDIREGLELCEKGLSMKPDSKFLLWMKGLALHKTGKHEEALKILKDCEEKWLGYNKDLIKDIKAVEQAIASHKRN